MTAAPEGLSEATQIGTFPILNKFINQVWEMRMHLHLVGCHQTGEHSKKERSASHVDHVLENFGCDHARAGC